MANPYAMAPLYHSPGVQSYCTPSDNLSLAGHYTDMNMRSSASWYGSTANDPRFASKYYFILKFNLFNHQRLKLLRKFHSNHQVTIIINVY